MNHRKHTPPSPPFFDMQSHLDKLSHDLDTGTTVIEETLIEIEVITLQSFTTKSLLITLAKRFLRKARLIT